MGNHLCCAKPFRTTATAKVIRWDDGSIENFREEIKVGELMLDNPQQFVCDFTHLQAGRRIAPLSAEAGLALGGLYVLLPMQKYLRCVLSASDMASLNLLASQCNLDHRKLSSSNSRVFPAVATGNLSELSSGNSSTKTSNQLKAKIADRFVVSKLLLDEDEDEDQRTGLGLSENRIRAFRYWKPALETIKESPRVCKP